MITIIKKGYVKPQYITKCNNCNTLFTFNNSDTEFVNVMYNSDLYINCPYCNNTIYDNKWEKITEESEQK